MSVNKLLKLVRTAKTGKSRNKREIAKKQIKPSKLSAKLDVIRNYTVNVALTIDEWRRTVDKADKDFKEKRSMLPPPYGLTEDSTTTILDSGTYLGLKPPPRPFLWRGINYIMKMTNDLQFLDTTLQGSYFGAPTLSNKTKTLRYTKPKILFVNL